MRIAVLVPVFNSETYLREAVDSVLDQTHQDFELVLIDDGSTDGSLNIMREYERRDDRVRVITHPNWGMGASLNHALETVHHDWVARMDADDIMEPHRLERQINFVIGHPQLDVAGSLVTYIDERGNEFGRSHPVGTTPESIAESRGTGLISGIYHPTVLMRREIVQSVGGYRPRFWPADDIDLWTRVDDAGGAILVQPEYLLRYRVHGGGSAFGKSREVQVIREWIRACSLRRRAGLSEPSREEFLDYRMSRPFHERLNTHRREIADASYRAAVMAYGRRQHRQMIGHAAVASLLGSSHIARQVRWRLFRPALSRLIRTTGA